MLCSNATATQNRGLYNLLKDGNKNTLTSRKSLVLLDGANLLNLKK